MTDIMSPAQRSALMARVKGRNTRLELTVFQVLKAAGLRFRRHVRALPGSPDIVFQEHKVVVFIDGDFWHGWRFPRWKRKLTPFWCQKIESNRRRDRRVHSRLRRAGWKVLRLWQHEVVAGSDYVSKVMRLLKATEMSVKVSGALGTSTRSQRREV